MNHRTMRTTFTAALTGLMAIAARADISALVPYTVPVETVKPLALSVMSGESVTWQISFTEGNVAKDLTGATDTELVYTRTGVTYQVTGSLHSLTGGMVRVAWAATNATPAGAYTYVISVTTGSVALCRARGVLTVAPAMESVDGVAPVWNQDSDLSAETAARMAGDVANSNHTDAATNAIQANVTNEAALRVAGDVDGTNWTDLAAVALSNLVALATNGTVAAAGDAYRLLQLDTNAWVTIANGTATLWRIERTTAVYVTAVYGDGYAGPAIGTTWTNAPVLTYGTQWIWAPPTGSDFTLQIIPDVGQDMYSSGAWGIASPSKEYIYSGVLPLTLNNYDMPSGDGTSVRIDWAYTTNAYPLATLTNVIDLLAAYPNFTAMLATNAAAWIATTNAIAAHNATNSAHADIRTAIVDGDVAGTNYAAIASADGTNYANTVAQNSSNYTASATNAHAAVVADTNTLGHVSNVGFSYADNLLFYTAPPDCTGMVFRFYTSAGTATNIYLYRDNP